MKFARQSLAALVLSVWLLALGYVALEHWAAMNGGWVVACQSHTGFDFPLFSSSSLPPSPAR